MENKNHSHTWGLWQYSDEYHAPIRYCQECGEGQSAFAWQKVAAKTSNPVADSKPSESETLIRKLIESGKSAQETGQFPPGLQDQIIALLSDPRHQKFLMENPHLMDELGKQLEEMGAMDMGQPVLNIPDYYRPGDGKFTLRWELGSVIPLPIPFDQLDRPTQFSVLFSEWSRREAEGLAARNAGNLEQAEKIFMECVERAKQIEVAELEARCYEDLMGLAQKRGNRDEERKWILAAQEARARQ
jgi:hypothetical protein